MRITVDMDVCQSHGQCVFAAPESFSFDDDEYLPVRPGAGRRAARQHREGRGLLPGPRHHRGPRPVRGRRPSA